ncbi:MAG: nucleotidyl transferase AbiEii/AbiGii toxin family protein [Desulfobacterales bacterium]|nr:nucleotidyl transferase AbiEii/AbiGii toxin family protein [Desulfobacterales bacterium]
MSKRGSANLAHSVRQRLLNISKDRSEDPNIIFIRYALERFLYRLSRSGKANQFILKGAMLFAIWTDKTHRPTRDLDLLSFDSVSDRTLIKTFQQITGVEVEPDGLVFDPKSITIAEIREGQDYPGKRLKISAKLGNTQTNLQIDIGFGDVVTPAAREIDYPTLLDFPPPHIKVYPPETVVAEKLQAMVAFDMTISRMKDFYDLWIISKQFSFEGSVLAEAIRATFEHRGTAIPNDTPTALTDDFAADNDKPTQWRAFLRRNGLEDAAVELPKIIEELRLFLIPPLFSAANNEAFNKSWTNGGPWS